MINSNFNLNQNLNGEIIILGRAFLKILVRAEQKIKDSRISTLPEDNKILLNIQNWQRVVALMIRKLCAYFLGETDYDFEIVNPIFVLLGKDNSNYDNDSF